MPDVIVMVFSAPFPVAATAFPTKFNVVARVDSADPSSLTVTPDVNEAYVGGKAPKKKTTKKKPVAKKKATTKKK